MLPKSWIDKTIGGRYKIDSLLGHGGMSTVYRAIDPNLRRKVAIKIIHPHLSLDPNFVNRFKEEAAAVARLRHPNIVQVFDFDIDDETYYMVMEYLVGETLQTRLKRLNTAQRHMPYMDVVDICTQLCDAVGYAHNHELIHRDIKPANIMLDLNNQAILMDFGIVKIVGGDFHTGTGATIGTAMYMSPEQIRSERADERSDIYSLGVTLYEMLSGQPPYQADSTVTLIMMVLNDPLPDLREVREEIPESLVEVVEKALAKDKMDRFQTMEEVAAALQDTHTHPAIIPPIVTIMEDAQVEAVSLPETQIDEPVEQESQPETQVDEQIEPVVTPTTQIEEPVEQESQPETQVDEQIEPVVTPTTQIDEPVEVSEVATELDSSEPSQPQELEEVAVLQPVEEQPVEPVATAQPEPKPQVRDTARLNYRRYIIIAAVLLLIGIIAAAGYFYITSQRAPELQLMPIEQPPVPISAHNAQSVVSLGMWETNSYIEELAYSPTGTLLGTANFREVPSISPYDYYGSLYAVDTGSLQKNLTGHTMWVTSAAFSPDGKFFATASDDGRVLLWQVSDGSLAREIEASTDGISNVDFSPNNLLLATASYNGDVGIWQVSDGRLLRTIRGHEDSVTDVEFSPDPEIIASSSDDNTIRLWYISDGSLIHTLNGHSGSIRELAFSPDGDLIAAGDDNSIKIWQAGNLVRTLQGHSEPILTVAFSPDGSLLVSGSEDGTLRFWHFADGELLHTITDIDTITSVAFSPDGHILASSGADGVIRFWGLSEAIPLEPEEPIEPPMEAPPPEPEPIGRPFEGQTVTIFTAAEEKQAAAFQAEFEAFTAETGIEVIVEWSPDFEVLAMARAEAGESPEIYNFPQPGMMADMARAGYLVDLGDVLGMDYLLGQYNQTWLDSGKVDDTLVGIWHNADIKSLVWYVKPRFEEAGYSIPETWDELMGLSDRIVGDGRVPWCIGIESASATGWVATDWIEDIMLRTTGVENYDAWIAGELKFDSPEVRNAFEIMGDIFFNEKYVFGGIDAILNTNFGDAPGPLFDTDPGCYLHRQGSFIVNFFPEDLEVGVDIGYFYLPPIDPAYGKPVLGSGSLLSMAVDNEATRMVMEFLTTPASVEIEVREGMFIAPHNGVPWDWYPSDVQRGFAEILMNAESFRFDASDLMPGPVSTSSFWAGVTDFIRGEDLTIVLQSIDASWPR